MSARHSLEKSAIRTRIEHWISSQQYKSLTVAMLARRNGLAYVGTQSLDTIPTHLDKGRMAVALGILGRIPAHASGLELGEEERLAHKKSLLRIRRAVGKRYEPPLAKFLYVIPDSPVTEAATETNSTSQELKYSPTQPPKPRRFFHPKPVPHPRK